MKHDIPKLEKKLRAMNDYVKELYDDKDCVEIFKITHLPGYTTPSEFGLVMAWLTPCRRLRRYW